VSEAEGKMLRNFRGKQGRFILEAIAALMIMIFIQVHFAAAVHAEEEDEIRVDIERIIDEQVGSDEVKSIEDRLEEYSGQEIKDIFEGYDPQSIMEDVAKGKFEFNLKGIVNKLLVYLFKEFYLNFHILIKLTVLVMLCALLKNLQASFMSESVGELAFYACYIVIVSIIIVSFGTALNLGTSIIDKMVDFMYATIPALITLLVSGGNFTSGGMFQPVLIMILEISAIVFKNVFMPLIFLSAVLSIVNNISDKIQVSKLAGFLRLITKWAIGLTLTIFVAVVSLQGAMGAVVDGVTAKTAKFAIGAFIPVVGSYLSDAAEAVIGCTLLIRNAAGLAVMLGVIGICLVPLLKIFALIALYRITCALVEPIAEKRITGCINDIAGSLNYVLGITAAVAFMFLISVTAVISAGNLSVMVR